MDLRFNDGVFFQTDPAAAPAEQPAPATPPATNPAAQPASNQPAKTETGAVETLPPAGANQPVPQPEWGSTILLFALMAGMIILMVVLPSRARKKQQKKFDEMVKNLKRDDRVMLQNGKFVTIDRFEGERVFVYADKARNVIEEYHKNAVSMLASEADKTGASR